MLTVGNALGCVHDSGLVLSGCHAEGLQIASFVACAVRFLSFLREAFQGKTSTRDASGGLWHDRGSATSKHALSNEHRSPASQRRRALQDVRVKIGTRRRTTFTPFFRHNDHHSPLLSTVPARRDRPDDQLAPCPRAPCPPGDRRTPTPVQDEVARRARTCRVKGRSLPSAWRSEPTCERGASREETQ